MVSFLSKVVRRCSIIHENKYTYPPEQEIEKKSDQLDVNCTSHGKFTVVVDSHLIGSGCPTCESAELSWISRAKNLHGDQFDYTKVEYETFTFPVILSCKEHKDFLVSPVGHLKSKYGGCGGCLKSIGRPVVDRNRWIERARKVKGEDLYDFSRAQYIKANIKVIIICKLCSYDWEVLPDNFISSKYCPNCKGSGRKVAKSLK